MKKILLSIAILAIITANSGCATVFGGRITDCQKTKQNGQPRQVRVAALVFDILLGGIIGTAIDFADNAIYVPCRDGAPMQHAR